MFSSADAMIAFDTAPVPVTVEISRLPAALLPTSVAVKAFDATSVVKAAVDPTTVELTTPALMIASSVPDPKA